MQQVLGVGMDESWSYETLPSIDRILGRNEAAFNMRRPATSTVDQDGCEGSVSELVEDFLKRKTLLNKQQKVPAVRLRELLRSAAADVSRLVTKRLLIGTVVHMTTVSGGSFTALEPTLIRTADRQHELQFLALDEEHPLAKAAAANRTDSILARQEMQSMVPEPFVPTTCGKGAFLRSQLIQFNHTLSTLSTFSTLSTLTLRTSTTSNMLRSHSVQTCPLSVVLS